jgi:hypothetical protein
MRGAGRGTTRSEKAKILFERLYWDWWFYRGREGSRTEYCMLRKSEDGATRRSAGPPPIVQAHINQKSDRWPLDASVGRIQWCKHTQTK